MHFLVHRAWTNEKTNEKLGIYKFTLPIRTIDLGNRLSLITQG